MVKASPEDKEVGGPKPRKARELKSGESKASFQRFRTQEEEVTALGEGGKKKSIESRR